MGHSIQEFLKKINSRLSLFDIASLFLTASVTLIFSIIIVRQNVEESLPPTYISGQGSTFAISNDARPFGSKSGTTYTFPWCQGAGMTLPKNKIYFRNEAEAQASGRTLSKLCQK